MGCWYVARSLRLGARQHVRIEHRTNASEQGDTVAANILGEQVLFDPVPFFWTDQYDVRIQVAGTMRPECERVVVTEEAATGGFVESSLRAPAARMRRRMERTACHASLPARADRTLRAGIRAAHDAPEPGLAWPQWFTTTKDPVALLAPRAAESSRLIPTRN